MLKKAAMLNLGVIVFQCLLLGAHYAWSPAFAGSPEAFIYTFLAAGFVATLGSSVSPTPVVFLAWIGFLTGDMLGLFPIFSVVAFLLTVLVVAAFAFNMKDSEYRDEPYLLIFACLFPYAGIGLVATALAAVYRWQKKQGAMLASV